MPRKPALLSAASFLAMSVLLSSCAGTLSRIFSRNDALPTGVPKEMQDKFEVRDEAESRAPKAPGTTAATGSTGAGPAVQDSVAATPSPAATASVGPALASSPARSPSRSRRRKRSHRKSSADFVGPLQPTFVFPNRRPAHEPIWPSERLTYDISYLGVAAGDFVLETLPQKYVGDRRVYHIRGSAHTSKVFSLFYKLDDMAETFIDYDGIFSHRFHISLQETKQARDSIELYDSQNGQTFYWNRWERPGHPTEENKVLKPMDPFPQDTLSSLYYLRSVPLPDGGEVDFPVVSEGNTVYAHVSVIRRETIDSPLGRVRCVVLKPEAKTHGVMTKKGDSYMWLTDDDHRILVRLEAKVKIGTVVASLKKVELGSPPSAGVTPVAGAAASVGPKPPLKE